MGVAVKLPSIYGRKNRQEHLRFSELISSRAPKKQRSAVAALVRTVFVQESAEPQSVLSLHRTHARGKIETLFGNLKTRGFDLEATHVTDPGKLETLLVIMIIAATLAAKKGAAAKKIRLIPDKTHGRKAISLFSLGLNTLGQILARRFPEQIKRFLDQLFSPNIPVKPSIRLGF